MFLTAEFTNKGHYFDAENVQGNLPAVNDGLPINTPTL
jgi:hypothetical protein